MVVEVADMVMVADMVVYMVAVILSDFHSVSVSEPSQSIETTLRWLTWRPTWRLTKWPTKKIDIVKKNWECRETFSKWRPGNASIFETNSKVISP